MPWRAAIDMNRTEHLILGCGKEQDIQALQKAKYFFPACCFCYDNGIWHCLCQQPLQFYVMLFLLI